MLMADHKEMVSIYGQMVMFTEVISKMVLGMGKEFGKSQEM